MQIKNGFLLSFIGLGISSCGVQKENDSNNRDIPVEVSPTLGVTANAPKDVIYKTSSSQNAALNSSFKSWFSSKIDNKSSLYIPLGNGGLGDDLNDIDNLTKYDGIPIQITNNGVKPQIFISADGDKGCSALFAYDNQLVKINPDGIDELKLCKLTITATGATSAGNIVTESATIHVRLNPTMKAYSEKNDPTYKYLQVYSSLADTNLIARWLKDNKQGNNLNLKYDPNKAIKVGKKLNDVNAITGAQNLKTLDLSGTDLKDLRAVILLNNVEKLDISDTKVDPKDLIMLGEMKNLKSLSVRNMNIKDITYITNNLKNLQELDISGNTQIDDLNDILNLKNLTSLKASNIGLKSLKDLTNFTQLSSIDLSNNDLSLLTLSDVQLLVNLYNIYELNLSNTHIKDEFLNSYFDKIGNRNYLRKLIIRNTSSNGDVDCKKINMIKNITNLANLISLEYLDLHGNGCSRNDYNYFLDGLKNTYMFSGMVNLNYLDISATGVNDLSGILNKTNLKTLKLYDPEGGGISMTKDGCLAVLSNFPDCYKLGQGSNKFTEYKKATSTNFIVPPNVYSIKVTACSGGDGGSGGSGGQGGTTGSLGTANQRYNYYNCNQFSRQISGSPYCWVAGSIGSAGGSGSQGQITSIENLLVTTHETYYQDLNGNCGAGFGGSGGGNGGVHCGWWGHCNEAPQPSNGSSGTNGQNKKPIVQEFKVTPGQNLNINVGKGGSGGAGGAGGIFGWCGTGDVGRLLNDNTLACAWWGGNGAAGGNGTDGYLKIEWLE